MLKFTVYKHQVNCLQISSYSGFWGLKFIGICRTPSGMNEQRETVTWGSNIHEEMNSEINITKPIGFLTMNSNSQDIHKFCVGVGGNQEVGV